MEAMHAKKTLIENVYHVIWAISDDLQLWFSTINRMKE